MSNSIWHDKNEKPVKVLYKNYIIITKWGSVLGESDVDSGYAIETDWAYLTDIIAQADKAERLQKAVDLAQGRLLSISDGYDIMKADAETIKRLFYAIQDEASETYKEIKQLIEHKE